MSNTKRLSLPLYISSGRLECRCILPPVPFMPASLTIVCILSSIAVKVSIVPTSSVFSVSFVPFPDTVSVPHAASDTMESIAAAVRIPFLRMLISALL